MYRFRRKIRTTMADSVAVKKAVMQAAMEALSGKTTVVSMTQLDDEARRITTG